MCSAVEPRATDIQEEGGVVELDPVRGNERARAIDQDGRVVACRRLLANADFAEVVALDEPERLQDVDVLPATG